MYARLETNSNFKNLNGFLLKVTEIHNDRVTCQIPKEGFDTKGNPLSEELITADFHLSEIRSFTHYKFT